MGRSTAHIMIDSHKCVACWDCIKACPQQVLGKVNILGLHKHSRVRKASACIGCKKCIKTCQHEAILSLD